MHRAEVLNFLSAAEDTLLFDKIYQLIHADRLGRGFASAMQDCIAEDPHINESVIADVSTIFTNTDGTYDEKHKFIDDLSNGNVINVDALLNSTNTFANIFDNNRFAISLFCNLKSYGCGKKFKGPGEYALALLAPDILTQSTTGDLVIADQNVEVKAATGRQGGRLGESGRMPNGITMRTTIKNFDIPGVNTLLETRRGLGLKTFTKLVSESGISTADKEAIGEAIFPPIFGAEYATAITSEFVHDSTGDATVLEYTKQNFNWYQAADKFDGILAISFMYQKTAYIKSADELVDLRNKQEICGPSVSIIPSGGTKTNEFLSQLSITKGMR